MNAQISNRPEEWPHWDADWIVNVQPNDSGSKRVKVRAYSEQSAMLSAEERFDCVAISARLA